MSANAYRDATAPDAGSKAGPTVLVARESREEPVPVVVGSETECGNVLVREGHAEGDMAGAAERLLREVDGVPALRNQGSNAGMHCMDWGRRFTRAGLCAYIDQMHFEIASAPTLSDFVACFHAGLRVAQAALQSAGTALSANERRVVGCGNSDSDGCAWAGHMNFCVNASLHDALTGETRTCAGPSSS